MNDESASPLAGQPVRPSAPADRDQIRARLLAALEAWLDEALAGPEPPAGIAAEILAESESHDTLAPVDDLYAIWSALTVLSHEVKLQGRYFKQLQDRLSAGQPGVAEDTRQALAEVLALMRASRQAEQTRQRRETIELLVDLRDRLVRGRATAAEQMEAVQRWLAAPSWLERLLLARRRQARALLEAVRALDEGYALGLSRIDEALGWQGVAEIACLGRPFDPHQMTAVDVEETTDHPDGTVVEVYLPGYEWRGELLRPARVKVTRSPQSGQESS